MDIDGTHCATPATVVPRDLAAIKARQQGMWASGDYSVVGTTLQIVGESLAEAADVRAGERVLDVAAGNGNATLAAARRCAEVTSTDFVPALLASGARRARAEQLEVTFRLADAEALPFADGAFDAALSTFGVMYAADPSQASSEIARVVRPGGRVGLACWTPEGFVGRLCRLTERYAPPPDRLASSALWGSEPRIVELFGPRAADIRSERKHFNFRYRSAAHFVDVFRTCHGPTLRTFAALDQCGQRSLADELHAELARRNLAAPHSLVVPGEYLEVVITLG